MQRFLFDIDIGGACNLRCPSCPQGNVKDYRLPHGFMAPELLERILEKAGSECRVVKVSLYNWAEPLLHPRLAELVRIVQDAGVPCDLSSNLIILPDADAIMAANPASFRISTSGFNQETYGRTHRGGDIERVKKHLIELAAAKKRQRAATEIYVYYHRYRHNLQEEPLMREFAADLGIKFHTDWAMMLPLEKILGYVEGDDPSFPLTEEDHALIGSLAVPLREALATAREYRNRPCSLRENAITLDFQGNVMLCCGVFDARRFTLGSYMDMALEEIQRLRRSHPLCGRCMHHGGHVYLTYGIDELDEMALANISPEDAELLGLRQEMARKRRQQRLRNLYGRFLPTGEKTALAASLSQVQSFFRRVRKGRSGKGESS